MIQRIKAPIPHELIESAQMDGSNAFQTALRIKLPLIRKWVVYMLVLSFALMLGINALQHWALSRHGGR